MSLKDLYQRFLADPKSASLASDVSLIYIPTTTKLEGPDAVASHLTKQQKIVQTKSQTVLGVVEGADSLCLDIETTLQFVLGGGAYLPSLDDNFLTDRVATFPTVHIVRFDGNGKIQNVRIYWEQASLLRQVEVLGSRGRSWPIRDATDQTRLIKNAIAATPVDVGSAPPPSRREEEKNQEPRNPVTPGKRRIKDPYAAGSLNDLLSPDRAEPIRAPRSAASAKPPPRDYEELFVGDAGEHPDDSPSKPRGHVAPKAGAGRSFQPCRLFDDDEKVASEEKAPAAYRPHPNKFNHFDIGADNSEREAEEKPAPGRAKSRHTAQWGFDDFDAPEKPRDQLRGKDKHNFPWSDEEPEAYLPGRQRQGQRQGQREPRDMVHDEPTDDEPKAGRILSSFQNKGLNIYQDPLFHGEDPAEHKKDRPLSVASHGSDRNNNFQPHWGHDNGNADIENQKPGVGNRTRAVKMMEPSWEAYDESPKKAPSTAPPRNGVKTAYHKSWDIGGE